MKKILLDKHLVGPWTTQRLGCGWFPDAVAAIGLAEVTPSGPVLVAGVLFSDYNQASIQMHVAAEPGARWMTKAYLGFLLSLRLHAGQGEQDPWLRGEW